MGLQTYTDNIFEQKKAEALKLMQEAEQEQKRMIANAVKAIKLDQLKCMALNIYYEARGEPFLGQVAVARVVMNRVADPAFPNDPCKVIYQKRNFINSNTGETKTVCQFSWVCENLTLPDKTNYHYQQAVKIAREVLKYDRWGDLLSDTTLFFHSIHVNPKWPHEPVERIGNHIFYEKNKD
jgi:spore germination cell wall hydrolase CwlJ-like protein